MRRNSPRSTKRLKETCQSIRKRSWSSLEVINLTLIRTVGQKDRVMDYTNVYRYIVLHEITKPKNNAMKDYMT